MMALPSAPAPIATPLHETLETLGALDRARFHMPGHAGQSLFPVPGLTSSAYAVDLTELPELDVLSEASMQASPGVLGQAQKDAAALYHARDAFLLVNGATAGIQAAMLAAFQPGDTVIVPRNAHRAVISGLILADLIPCWVLPEALLDWGLWGGVSLETLQAAYAQHPHAKGIILTSPTYQGVCSDLEAIGRWCQSHNLRCVVDAAHGSLHGLHPALPPSAVMPGVDAVVVSLHKGAGSLTQTALALLPHGSGIATQRYQQTLNTLHTTSPSYLLLASAVGAIGFLGSPTGQAHLQGVVDAVQDFGNNLKASAFIAQGLRVGLAHTQAGLMADPLSIVLQCQELTGDALGDALEETGLVAYEMTTPDMVLFKAGLGTTAQDLDALYQAIETVLAQPREGADLLPTAMDAFTTPLMALSPRQAFFAPGEDCLAGHALGRVSRETWVHCPPGIPLLVPGEVISADHIALMQAEGKPRIDVVVG